MREEINFGIGFVTGRPNVCQIINNYYTNILEQVNRFDKKVKITIFILFDLNYQSANKTDFYNILPEVYKNIDIKYITPEDIEEDKKQITSKTNLTKSDVESILGYGHARGRNTVMFHALKDKIDYLLFWDDDEYPVANLKGKDGKIEWKKQDNVLKHLENIKDYDITIGHHSGYISPIPYIEIGDKIKEEVLKYYIEALSNDAIKWEQIKEKILNDKGISYADEKLASGIGAYDLLNVGDKEFVTGSTLCLNMRNIEKIPAFYNPENARGEDTFFSTALKGANVRKIPVYHFHDGFLKYTEIMREKMPNTLRKIEACEDGIKTRFLQVSKGWVRYKPLLIYILDRKHYKERIEETYKKLESSIPEINKVFKSNRFEILLDDLKEYDKKVENSYEEYLRTNRIWNKLKNNVKIFE